MNDTDLPWFRFYKETVDDPKLRTLAFEDRWHYVALLCCKAQGILDAPARADDPLVALPRMRRQVCAKLGVDAMTLDEIERRLVEADLIDAKTLQPRAWDKRQFQSDSSTPRTRAWRSRQRDGDSAPVVKRHEYTPEFEQAWAIYPSRPGANKLESFKAWKARIGQGRTANEMIDGVRRYAVYCQASQTESRFIKQPATFFGPHEHFLADWTPPTAKAPAATPRSERNSAWMNEMTGNEGGRDVRPGEYIDVPARTI